MPDYEQDIIRRVRIETQVDTDTIKKSSTTLDNFYKKYQSKEMKVDTSDFFKAADAVRTLKKELDMTKKNSPHMEGIIEQMSGELEKAAQQFERTIVHFTNGDIAHGLNEAVDKITQGFQVKTVDLGDFLSNIKEKARSAVDSLQEIGALSVRYNGSKHLNFNQLDVNGLNQAIDLMRDLYDAQKELDEFNGQPLKQENFYSNYSTQSLLKNLESLKKTLDIVKELNLNNEQLSKRRELIGNVDHAFDKDYFRDYVKPQAAEDDVEYDWALSRLQEYISNTENLINDFKSNSSLFTSNELSNWVNQMVDEIKTAQTQLGELQQLKGVSEISQIGGDFTEVTKILGEIKESLQTISDVFKNENTAMRDMAESGVTSFTSLSQAIIEVYNNLTQVQSLIDNISQKDFNITNITQTGGTNDNKAIHFKEQSHKTRQALDHAKKLAEEVYQVLPSLRNQDINLATSILGDFFTEDFDKQFRNAKTIEKLTSMELALESFIASLIKLNELREKYGLGEWTDTFVPTKFKNTQPIVNQKPQVTDKSISQPQIPTVDISSETQQMDQLKASVDEVSKAIGRKNAGFIKEQEIVNTSVEAEKTKLKELVDVLTNEISVVLDNIKVKFAESFVVPELDKNNLQLSFDEIYNKFIELKDKIGTMQIDIGINTANITAAIQEALYSKEIAANYRKANFDDLYKLDLFASFGKENYVDQITGEVLSESQARKDYNNLKEDWFVTKFGTLVGTMQDVIEHLIANSSQNIEQDQNDWTQVIVEAINTQGGSIVEAIKLLIPKHITDNTDDSALISAFNTLTEAIKEQIANEQVFDARGYFNHILNNNHMPDTDVQNALMTLGLMSKSGKAQFSMANIGGSNSGIVLGEDLVYNSIETEQIGNIYELMEKQNQAYEMGAQVARIIAAHESDDMTFRLETKLPGRNFRVNAEETGVWDATDEQIDRLLYTFEMLEKSGLVMEFGGDNVLYDRDKGFSLVDLQSDFSDYHWDDQATSKDMLKSFVRHLYNIIPYDSENMSKKYDLINRFEERSKLPTFARLVNKDTIMNERAQQNSDGSIISAKVTPTMEEGAIAKLVEDNVAKTPATVKINPVTDDHTSTLESELDKFSTSELNDLSKMIDDELENIITLDDLDSSEFGIFDDDDSFLDASSSINKSNLDIVDSALDSQKAVNAESQSATDAAQQFVEAANAKKEFVEANKLVAESATESVNAIKQEVKAIDDIDVETSNDGFIENEAEMHRKNAEAIREETEAEKELAKAKDIYIYNKEEDKDEKIGHMDVYKYQEDDAFVTENVIENISRDKNGNEVTTIITSIVKDFEKFNKEEKKTEENIARVQGKLDEFIKKFKSKTGGNAQFIEGFDELSEFKIDKDNIEEAFNLMTKLQAKYNELEGNFRKGQASLNPFTNAINKASNIDNIFGEVKYKFDALTNASEELIKNFTQLETLSTEIKSFVEVINSNPKSITPEKFSNFSKQVGEFNLLKTQVEGSIKKEGRIEAENERQRKKSVQEYIDLLKLQYDYEKKAAKETDGSNMQYFYNEQVAKVKNKINSIDKEKILNHEDELRLLSLEEKKQRDIAEIIAKKQNSGQTIPFDSEEEKIQKKYESGYLNDNLYNDWQMGLAEYRNYMSGVTKADEETIQKKKQSLLQMYDMLTKVGNASKSFFASGGEILSKEMWLDEAGLANVSKSLNDLYVNIVSERFEGMKTSVTGVNEKLDKLNFTVDDGKGKISQYTIALNKTTGAVKLLSNTTKPALTVFQKLGQTLKKDFTGILHATIGGTGAYSFIRYIRQGIEAVRELDLALTELKKVTDETEEAYDRFLVTASKSSSKIGSTISAFTQATAEFARLGYDMDLSSEMAKAALVYTNVGDGIDNVTSASESIISTMKGFGLEASEAMRIVDRFNEVGNNFAITSVGIGEALTQSASALSAAGNTIDESIGLITAANSVVQNPNTVGTALKTLSLRIRGAKTELEEAGLETENMAETTSSLQKKILALTSGKVDVMLDANTFKNTTQILREMSTVWEDMTDIQQAAALELLGGKRQANILAAIIDNFDVVEDTIESSLNSEGSALEENEKVLDSIQGRINLFNNALETMWNHLLDDDWIKLMIDGGTELVKIIDKLGSLKTILFGILTYYSVFKKDKIDFAEVFGIQNGKDGGYDWTFGQKGVAKWINNKYQSHKNKKSDVASALLGDPEVEVQNFAEAIKDNINDYVSIDTSKIDSEIEDVQNKLMVARQQLEKSKTYDWDYFKSMGSKSPAKDRDNLIAEKTQEVNKLENQLINLEQQKNNVVSSATTSYVEAIVGSPEETKSILSVLSQIQNVRLEMPNMDESNLAKVMDEINVATQEGQVSLLNYASTLGDNDLALRAYIESLDGGTASISGFNQFIKTHNAGIKASGVAAKAAAVGHALLNAAISMGISLLISGAITLWNKFANAQKELAEAAKEATNEYKRAIKSLKDHDDIIKDIETDYSDLAKGVDNFGKNVSLSSDEYERYNEITNQIAEMFPEMVAGYTEEGNAIIKLKGNVDELTKAYENEKKAARDAILTKQNQIFDDFLNNTTTEVGTFFNNHIGYNDYIEIIEAYIKQANGDTQAVIDLVSNHPAYSLGLEKLKEDLGYDKWATDWKADLTSLTALLSQVQAEARAASANVHSVLNAYLEQDFDYLKLTDEAKAVAQSIISAFDTEFYSQFETAEEMEAWVVTKLIKPLQDAGNTAQFELILDLQTKFNNGEITANEYQEQVQNFLDTLEKLGFDEDIIKSVSLMFNIEDISTKVESAKDLLVDSDDAKAETLTKEELDIIDKNKTKWKEEYGIDDDTLMSWEDLKNAIQKVKDSMWEASSTFDEISKEIDSIQSAYDTLSDAVDQYNQNGYLTLDSLQALLSLEPEYLALLQMENGQLSINQSGFESLIQAKLAEAKATAVQSAITQLNALANRTEADAINESTNAANNSIGSLGSYADSLGVVAQNAISAAGAVATFNAAVEGAKANELVDQSEIDAVLANMNNQINLIDSIGSNLGTNFKGIVSSKKGSDSEDNAFKKAMDYWENRISANQAKYEQIQNEIDLLEKQGKTAGEDYYKEQVKLENERLKLLKSQKAEAQKYLKTFKEGSEEWWEAASTLNDIEGEIDDVTSSLQDLSDAIAQIKWDVFDESHTRYGNLKGQLESVRELVAPNNEEDWFDDEGMWTEKGVAVAGAYIQEIEIDDKALKETQDKLRKFEKGYKGNEKYFKDTYGIDSEQEYYDKRQELIEQEQEYAKNINSNKQAVIDMYEAQIDAVEEYTNKLIDSYNEYIDTVKEALDAERDLYEFKKDIAKQTKDIAEMERRIASLSGSDNAADIAERRKLEAELAEAKEGLNDSYYAHSKDSLQNALEEEANAYEETMNKFIEGLRESLEKALQDMDLFMEGVYNSVITNAPSILEQYKSLELALDDAIINPWEKATAAITKYGGVDGLGVMNTWIKEGGVFSTFKTSATDALKSPWEAGKTALSSFTSSVKTEMEKIVKTIESNVSSATGKLNSFTSVIKDTNKQASNSGNTSNTSNTSNTGNNNKNSGSSAYNANVAALQEVLNGVFSANIAADGIWGPKTEAALKKAQEKIKNYLGGKGYRDLPSVNGKFDAVTHRTMERYIDMQLDSMKNGPYIGGVSGGVQLFTKCKNKLPVAFHAKGTLGTKQDEWAITDESWIGEEITLAAGKNGQLQYLKKGSAVMPADISANLVEWGKLNPNMMNITSPSAGINLMTNYVSKPELNLSFDALVKAGTITQEALPAVKELVQQELNKFTKQLNYSIKRVGAN